MEILSWRNGGPSLYRGDKAPQRGWYALYTQHNVGGTGCDDYAVVQILPAQGQLLTHERVFAFCAEPENRQQGAFLFDDIKLFEQHEVLFA